MSESVIYTILTEEAPDILDISFIANKMFNLDTENISKDDLELVINDDKFTGKWKLKIENYIFNIQLFKGYTSCVDYILFDGNINLDTENGENAMCILESTKTTDDKSRNTSVYQRITKFTSYYKMFPKSKAKQFMLYNQNWESETITETARFGFMLMKKLEINVYCKTETYNNLLNKYDIQEFNNVEDIIEFKNRMSFKNGNTSVKINKKKISKDNKLITKYYISCKLDKGNGYSKGRMSHDPNIGLLSGLINCIKKFSDSEIVITDHGLEQSYFDNKPNSKFWHSVYGIDLDFQDVIVKSYPMKPKMYFKIECNMTEKLSTILFDSLNSHNTIFSNHSGCALTYITTENGKISVGKKMPRPDIVFCDEENKNLIIVEGKLEKEIKQGIKQLDDLKEFIKLISTHYPSYNIKKGLCITINNIVNINEYLNIKYPVLFALDKEGKYIIN